MLDALEIFVCLSLSVSHCTACDEDQNKRQSVLLLSRCYGSFASSATIAELASVLGAFDATFPKVGVTLGGKSSTMAEANGALVLWIGIRIIRSLALMRAGHFSKWSLEIKKRTHRTVL